MPITNIWRGGAINTTAQVDYATPANVEIGDIFTMTLTGENGDTYAITFTAVAATVQNVVEGLKAAALVAAADDDSLWSEVTVTEDDTKCIITADTAGVPFHLTCSATNGGAADTQTLTRAASVANVGAYDYGTTTANWSGKAVPAAGDTVIIPDSDYSSLYSLDQDSVALAAFSVDIRSKTSQNIGAKGEYLQLDADTVNYYSVGRAWLDVDGLTSDMVITSVGRSGSDGTYGLNLKGSNSGFDIIATLGSGQTLGIAAQVGESAVFDELRVTGGAVYVGNNTGLKIIEIDGGCTLYSEEDLDTRLTVRDGTAYVQEGTIPLIHGRGGTIYLNAPGTHAAIHLFGSVRLDFSQDDRPKTVTDVYIYSKDVQIYDPKGVVTWTNGFDFVGCENVGQVTLPANMSWPAPSAL